jgi:aspartyl-tRNA(Asn)/glutamyl-tRNA(Gln) amidotransferase subunit A
MAEAVERVRESRPPSSVPPAVGFQPRPRAAQAPLSPGRAGPTGSIARAGDRLDSGQTTCAELLDEALEAIARDQDELNAFAEVCGDAAKADAATLDDEMAAGNIRGPLHGIPISVKDIIDVAGVPTRAGSAAYCEVPAADAPSVALLRRAGAVIIGKAATHEFALGVTTPQSRNPHDPRRIPGGSSGGSAIAVAKGMGLGSLGTDTRASIRVPAALSGVVGFKPTYGVVDAGGLVQLSWSMDHVAAMAASVADAAILLDVLANQVAANQNLSGFCGAGASGLVVGVPADGCVGADPAVAAAFDSAIGVLGGLVSEVREVKRPCTADFELANSAGLIVSRCEAAAYHRLLGLDRRLYWAETRDQLDAADGISAADYLDAQRLRAVLAEQMLAAFEGIDVMAMPTCLVAAPLVAEVVAQAARYLMVLSRNCIVWSLIGFPAVSIPCGLTPQGLPAGLQLVAPPREDSSLVALGSAFENTVGQ